MSLSSNVIQHKNSLASSDGIFVLLKAEIPSLGSPVYLANNNEDVTWNSQTWQKFGFDIDEITEDSDGSIPEVTISVANASRMMEAYIIEYDLWLKTNYHENIKATIYIVSEADLANTTPIASYKFDVGKFTTNPEWVEFTLTFENFYIKRFPKNRIMRNSCRWVFGSTQCGYSIVGSETCNKTLTACRSYNNSSRFGGFPSVGGKLSKVFL